ncbi:SIMPL domain-containing protein [Akkermansiaceae bacterium]|nr:SIMPL domain-containing protein [Akkermansiaceae bacterium]
MNPSCSGRSNIAVALIVSAGIAAAGYFASQTLYNAKVAVNTAQAKGLAERTVIADRADWTIGLTVSGKSKSEIPELYAQAEAQQKQIVAILREAGFNEGEVRAEILTHSMREYRDENQNLVEETHSIGGSISVSTPRVELVDPARSEVNKLLSQGMNITNFTPKYDFTGINEIKPAMLKEAARNARIAASEFAQNAGAKVGKIRSAYQGGFTVEDAGSGNGSSSLTKEVRVVTTIDFYLTD